MVVVSPNQVRGEIVLAKFLGCRPTRPLLCLLSSRRTVGAGEAETEEGRRAHGRSRGRGINEIWLSGWGRGRLSVWVFKWSSAHHGGVIICSVGNLKRLCIM